MGAPARRTEGGGPTGGTDNTIAVYNLRRRRFHGKLTQQGGGAAVNCLAFCGESHLISAAEDGSLCIWRTSDWECLLTMRGHKGAVHDVSVHPSGRLALSVAADRKLMLWNLLTGKCNYTLALPAACRLVRWTPAADAYVVWFGDAEATDVELLAPGVVVARVPAEAAAGPAAVRAAIRAADGALTQLAGELAFQVERGR